MCGSKIYPEPCLTLSQHPTTHNPTCTFPSKSRVRNLKDSSRMAISKSTRITQNTTEVRKRRSACQRCLCVVLAVERVCVSVGSVSVRCLCCRVVFLCVTVISLSLVLDSPSTTTHSMTRVMLAGCRRGDVARHTLRRQKIYASCKGLVSKSSFVQRWPQSKTKVDDDECGEHEFDCNSRGCAYLRDIFVV